MKYCTYKITYTGSEDLPPYYIGSTEVFNLLTGYRGSLASKDYSELWNLEVKNNPAKFSFEILEYFTTRDLAYLAEYELHKKYNVVKNPLFANMAMACKGGYFWDRKGTKHSDESKHKMSLSKTGFTHSEETKEKIGSYWKGRKRGPQSEEHKQKLIEKRKGRQPWNKGKSWDKETIKKMSDAKRGKTHSEETKRKMSESQRARRNRTNLQGDPTLIKSSLITKDMIE